VENNLAISVLFDQKKCFVVNKPGGLLTQAPPGIDSMELRTKRLFKSYQPEGSQKKIYVGVPHRLDRPVSGAILLCKNKQTTKEISRQFQNREVRKVYWAVVQGELSSAQGTWTDTMRKISGQAKSELVAADHENAQYAELDLEVLGAANGLSWIRIELKTGRTHQIRLQTSSRGHAILGDHLYESQADFGPDTMDLRARWISLHARHLEFTIPETGKRAEITAPLPEWWAPCIEAFPKMQTLDF
jgi:RluA family pseudouridine synthase